MAALENFWNGWASARNDIVLTICSSATSWIISKVIHNKGGLYNRLTERIPLQPFILAVCEEFAADNQLSLTIDEMFFSENAPLADEFGYLYAAIFKNPETYLMCVNSIKKRKMPYNWRNLYKILNFLQL